MQVQTDTHHLVLLGPQKKNQTSKAEKTQHEQITTGFNLGKHGSSRGVAVFLPPIHSSLDHDLGST